jgi:hypothetical protein
MITKFQNTNQAIAYVCQGVLTATPEVQAEVSWYPDGKTLTGTRTAESLAEVRHLLSQTCRRFYHTTVALSDARNDQPSIAALQCRCDKFARTTCRLGCRHHEDRPIALVVPQARGLERPSPEELAAMVVKMQQAIQAEHDRYARSHRSRVHGRRLKAGARG